MDRKSRKELWANAAIVQRETRPPFTFVLCETWYKGIPYAACGRARCGERDVWSTEKGVYVATAHAMLKIEFQLDCEDDYCDFDAAARQERERYRADYYLAHDIAEYEREGKLGL